MELKKIPSIIEKTQFNNNGLAETDSGLLVPVYVASQFGFSSGEFSPKKPLEEFYNKLKQIGILPICPFTACAEYLDFTKLENAKTQNETLEFWDEFNKIVGPVNYGILMPKTKFMIAILDGGHTVDDGVAAEIAYYATKHNNPIIAIRSDIRLAENPSAPINPAIRYFIDQGPTNGKFFNGTNAYKNAIEEIKGLVQKIKN